MNAISSSRLLAAFGILGAMAALPLSAQIPAIPEPPIILYGTVIDKANNLPVTITSVTWQVSDGTTNHTYSSATLPATRVISNGQSFYMVEIPHETRIVQNASGQITLIASANSLELKSPSPTYTLTSSINGSAATVSSIEGADQPEGTAHVLIDNYSPTEQGRMLRVDLFINADPYLTWAAQYFNDPADPSAAKSADPDHDGFTNEQEATAGTDPTNGTSALRLTNFSRANNGSAMTLQWQSVIGKTYQIQTSADLKAWADLGSTVLATNAVSTYEVPIAGNPERAFYRIKVLP